MEQADSLGAIYQGDGRCAFLLWAPKAERAEVRIVAPADRLIPMERDDRGYHRVLADGVEPGSLYLYRLDGGVARPDPASRHQPQGVHGPSRVVDPRFEWTDGQWSGLTLREYILYELHVGTFSPEGTFEGVIRHLDELRDLGITALELMPVAQFPGSRNWGYDGVYPFAVQDSYGGPDGLKRLVDACHRAGIAVVLDVVYNHLGPEGNYMADFAPYFADTYRTAWGAALNFDGPWSDEVRRYFIENALAWIREFRIDAFRLDAVHGIFDQSARPFLEELAEAVHDESRAAGRPIHLIAESNLNDPRFARPVEEGGLGLDALWNDGFHHALHAILTGEREAYYVDFGRFDQMKKAFRDGFVFTGDYSVYRRRRYGRSSRSLPAERLVVYAQNHDQVGNRARGERLSTLVGFEALKLAAGAFLLSPYTPLLFMGEEWGETVPFAYFIDHSDPALVEATRRGRLAEFAHLKKEGHIPDPADESTFLRARLKRNVRESGRRAAMPVFYRELIRIRKELAAAGCLNRMSCAVAGYEAQRVLFVRYWSDRCDAAVVLHFGRQTVSVVLPFPAGRWAKRLDSAEACWDGPGSGLPDCIASEGESRLDVAGESISLYWLEKGR
jgi:maltooligosyltrehalose trehalohydrolase